MCLVLSVRVAGVWQLVVYDFVFSERESGVGIVLLCKKSKGSIAPSVSGHGVRRPRACSQNPACSVSCTHVPVLEVVRRIVVDVVKVDVPLVVVFPRRSGAV